MTFTLTTKFNKGDRVWMPDGRGGRMKGRVVSISLFNAKLTDPAQKVAAESLNYRCVTQTGDERHFHEYQLEPRNPG